MRISQFLALILVGEKGKSAESDKSFQFDEVYEDKWGGDFSHSPMSDVSIATDGLGLDDAQKSIPADENHPHSSPADTDSPEVVSARTTDGDGSPSSDDRVDPLNKCQREEDRRRRPVEDVSKWFNSDFTSNPGMVKPRNDNCYKVGAGFGEVIVTIYFIRHAQSEWNFRKDVEKKTRWNTEDVKDAKLTGEGIESALAIHDWLFDEAKKIENPGGINPHAEQDRKFLAEVTEGRKAIFVTSNLRRAVLTLLAAFSDRFIAEQEKIYILSALQEISSNWDARTLAGEPADLPALTHKDEKCPLKTMKSEFDASCNLGDRNKDDYGYEASSGVYGYLKNKWKSVTGGLKSDPKKRLDDFCIWVWNRKIEESGITDFIVSGHSSWLLKFFRAKLEKNNNNEVEKQLKKEKLGNGGLISFQLKLLADGSCEILSGSTRLIVGAIKAEKRLAERFMAENQLANKVYDSAVGDGDVETSLSGINPLFKVRA